MQDSDSRPIERAIEAIEESMRNAKRLVDSIVGERQQMVADNKQAVDGLRRPLYIVAGAIMLVLLAILIAVVQGKTQRSEIQRLQYETLHRVETQCPAPQY